MHDLIIREGNVVDGSGAPARVTDIAVNDGIVTELGRKLGRARRKINAQGSLVTPGFVDVHTHYDGQATWDPYLTPSSWHGVTTAIFGNCGVGFAPVRPKQSPYLINLMEGVEDIPGSVLAEGVSFNWESFPQFLDVLDDAPKAIDIGAQVPHAPLRFYVMGERGADHASEPTDSEITSMGVLLEEALNAGALGFTTSRTTKHLTRDGRNTPSLTAGEAELKGLALAMKRAGRGVLQVNSDFGRGEFEILRMAAELSGRPLSILLLQVNNAPELWRRTRQHIHEARAAGLSVNAQVGCRPIVIMMGLETTINPFSTHPAWRDMADLSPAQRLDRLRHDSKLRRALVTQMPNDQHTRRVSQWMPRTYVVDEQFDYEPSSTKSIASMALAAGRSVWEIALEAMMSHQGKRLLAHTFENYAEGNLEVVREMLLDEASIMGLGDGGAHVCTVCDEGAPTFLLSHWARDRKRGARLPLEFLVKKHTLDSAIGYGLPDRGLLSPGYRADINIIDFDRLRLRDAEVAYDLPAGGKRLVQRADGYLHTFVAGTEIVCNDEHTGALPGRLLR
ncbi:MAG: amidohydrolase family protein [Betaproteobacteria bacterium]|jgi:N-acyl-D-aspartate/D-glutamate deacylase|nr:MAG: amidohydrolase family protein [Betaproteobacteria bacterium]